MKSILLFFLVLFSFPVSSQPTMFMGYDSFCGLPVLVEPTSQLAVATIRNNSRVIIVDPSVMSNWKISRIFALAHECGHHILGHLSNEELFSRTHMNATTRQELSADCWAAEVLAANGYYKEIERAIHDNHSEGPMMNGTYPAGMTRALYIAQCAGIKAKEVQKPSAQCLAQMDERCMASCQNHFGYSYSTCKSRMCNSPRQIESNISRCTK